MFFYKVFIFFLFILIMKIQKARKKDLREIVKIMHAEFSKPPFKEKTNFKLGEIYRALINKKIVGIVVFKIEQYWEGPVLIIEDLAVKHEFKKQNIGKNLMKFVEDCAKKSKIKKILFTTNKKSKAMGFYKKIGYKEEKNRINMTKKLK